MFDIICLVNTHRQVWKLYQRMEAKLSFGYFIKNHSNPGKYEKRFCENLSRHRSNQVKVQLRYAVTFNANSFYCIIRLINFSIFVDRKIYTKLNGQRMYNFKLNFETGRLTGPAKDTVKKNTIDDSSNSINLVLEQTEPNSGAI